MYVFEERAKPEYPGESLSEQSKGSTNPYPHMTLSLGIESELHLVGGQCSHRYATNTKTMLMKPLSI